MKLSTRSRYGLRALLDIAVHESGAPVRLREIARRQCVSLSYLEHIVSPLIACGILRSTRGIHGGVSLVRRPADISVREAVTALEGDIVATDCVRDATVCPRSQWCGTRGLWIELTEAIEEVLGTRTLADLMRGDDGADASSCAPEAMRPMSTPLFGVSTSEKSSGQRAA